MVGIWITLFLTVVITAGLYFAIVKGYVNVPLFTVLIPAAIGGIIFYMQVLFGTYDGTVPAMFGTIVLYVGLGFGILMATSILAVMGAPKWMRAIVSMAIVAAVAIFSMSLSGLLPRWIWLLMLNGGLFCVLAALAYWFSGLGKEDKITEGEAEYV